MRPLDLETLVLGRGNHPADDGKCVMEAVSYMAGEPHSDHPACASPVISAFMRKWNDDLDDETRQRLKPYIPRLIGTNATRAVESRRAWLVTDWLVRVHTPAWLELGGMKDQADALRALPEVTSTASAKSAQPTIETASEKAAAAGAAAWDAAEDAAWDAARTAAEDAARDAAWAAAWAAAWDAARDAAGDAARAAAWDAARDAAGAKLKPTVVSLQDSAFQLLDRLIAEGKAI